MLHLMIKTWKPSSIHLTSMKITMILPKGNLINVGQDVDRFSPQDQCKGMFQYQRSPCNLHLGRYLRRKTSGTDFK